MEITGVNLEALGHNFSKLFQRGFDEVTPTWQRVAVEVPSSTLTNDYAWLVNFPGMREWIGPRILKELSGHDYSIKNRDWESTVRVMRKSIEDDNIGLYAPMLSALGIEAAQHPDTLIWEALEAGTATLCYDGQNYFDEDHPIEIEGQTSTFSNLQTGDKPAWYLMDTSKALKPLILQMRQKARFQAMTDPRSERVFMNNEFVYGADARYAAGYTFPQLAFCSKAELNADNLEAAILQMNAIKNEAGRPLGIKPNLLVVGSSNQFLADKLIKSATLANGEQNIHAGRVEVLVAPKLN